MKGGGAAVPPFSFRGFAAPDQIGGHAIDFCGPQKDMSGLSAEMGHIDGGHRIGRTQAQHLALRHRDQPLARTQDGQGAKEPGAIQINIPVQRRLSHNANVTRCNVTCA